VKTINDKSDFVVVQQALSVLGFQDEECQVCIIGVEGYNLYK